MPGSRRTFAIAGALCLAACGMNPYSGIPLQPGVAHPALQEEVVRAMSGDKHAQLALGKRYETGNGVPQNYRKAKYLYEQAASDSGGTMWVYSPPVGKEGNGRTIPIDMGPKVSGLPEARDWLAGMRARIVERERYQ